jgi:putative FmdB family regulatory protein
VPIYTWKCEACGDVVELVRPMRQALEPVICACGVPRVQELSAAHISPDIAPYRAVTGDRAGQFITSRREHREFLKRNRLVEIGNDKPKDTSAFRKVTDRKAIRAELARVVPEVRRKIKQGKRA